MSKIVPHDDEQQFVDKNNLGKIKLLKYNLKLMHTGIKSKSHTTYTMYIQTENWTNECIETDECLTSSVDTIFRNTILKILVLDDYMSDQNILDFFVDRNFKKLNFGYIQDIDMAIGHEILGTWSAMNGGGSNIKDSMFESLKNWNETESLDKADINQILPLFNQPKIHGNSQKEYVLIPLCIFRRNPMEPCSLFETSSSSIGQTKCYTFNSNPNKDMKGGKVGPDNGLRFMTKVRTGCDESFVTVQKTIQRQN